MASAKMYKLGNDLTLETVGHGIESFLRDKKKMRTTSMQTTEGYVIKAESEETWLRFIGLGLMQQVHLFRSGDVVSVTVTESRWVEKFLAWFVYLILETFLAFVFWPLLFVPFTLWVCVIVGSIRQYMLPNQILDFVEMFIMGGGRNVSVDMNFKPSGPQFANPGMNMGGGMNVNTGMNTGTGTNMGANPTAECPNCHAIIPKDMKFCPQCGSKMGE